MSRNIWLSFSEWELISTELSDQEYHSFQLSKYQLNEWKDDIKRYHKNNCTYGEPSHCFKRVGIYPEVNEVKSAEAANILHREFWREQDLFYVMDYPQNFIGFIINYCDDVDMDITFEEWESIRLNMKKHIDDSNQRFWFKIDLVDLYKKLNVPQKQLLHTA